MFETLLVDNRFLATIYRNLHSGWAVRIADEGVHFIGKPFTPESLARKVREAIGGKNEK